MYIGGYILDDEVEHWDSVQWDSYVCAAADAIDLAIQHGGMPCVVQWNVEANELRASPTAQRWRGVDAIMGKVVEDPDEHPTVQKTIITRVCLLRQRKDET